MQAQLGHSDIRTTLNIYTQTLDPEVLIMANQVTNRLPQLADESDPRVQFTEIQLVNAGPMNFLGKMKMEVHGAERWPSG